MSKNGETSGKGGTVPKRTLCKKKLQYGPLPRSDKKVMRVDAKLGRLLISSSASCTLLDNPEFGVFCEEILAGRYNVPTRGYMLANVINPMFHEAKENIKMKLQKCKCIGLTTDAWTSIAQKSFITITAHIIDEDDDFKLVAYVLDTQEIIQRHTSEKLLQHIQNVLKDYDIDVENNHKLTLNYNATNSTDIHEQDIETADEVNYLNPETDTAEFTINDDSQTQFVIPGNDIMQDEINSLYNQNSNHSTQSNDTDISGHDLTFTSDNTSDISKALKKLGQYRWFGCAGHHSPS